MWLTGRSRHEVKSVQVVVEKRRGEGYARGVHAAMKEFLGALVSEGKR